MRQFIIPESFFKTLAEKPKLYSRLWFEWLAGYADNVLEPTFLEKLDFNFYSEIEIREIYEVGVQLLGQGQFSIVNKGKHKSKVDRKLTDEDRQSVNKIVEYLNSKAETSYLPTTQSTIDNIMGRLKEGFSVSDFFIVIDNKVADWKGCDAEKYLRPLTLFSKEKFENYVNEKRTNNARPKTTAATDKLEQFGDSLQRAKQAFIFGS
jgi:hypothetical protein